MFFISRLQNHYVLPFPFPDDKYQGGFGGSSATPVTPYKVRLRLVFMSPTAAKSYGMKVRGQDVLEDQLLTPLSGRSVLLAAWQLEKQLHRSKCIQKTPVHHRNT